MRHSRSSLSTIAATLWLLASAQQAVAAPSPAGFFARLAPELGLTPKADRAGDYWQTNTLNPAQRLLLGGTSMMGFHPEPVGDFTQTEANRLDAMCTMDKKGLSCNVAGPVRMHVTAGGKDVRSDARRGDRATLWTSGSRVRCRDLSSG